MNERLNANIDGTRFIVSNKTAGLDYTLRLFVVCKVRYRSAYRS